MKRQRRKPVRTGPLKKVVDWYSNEYGLAIEKLECGHEQPTVKDIYGETNAYRRRCNNCRKEGGKVNENQGRGGSAR